MKENMRKNKKTLILLIIAIIIVIIVIPPIINPLMRSERKIEKDILELTPIGTNREDVVEIIKNHSKWKSWKRENSNRYITLNLGKYLWCDVVACWYFDEDEKLRRVIVTKYWDSL